MRASMCLLISGLITLPSRAAVVNYEVTPLGKTSAGIAEFQYSYALSDAVLAKNQDLDIRFDPAVFSSLSNGTAGNDFNLVMLEPNNPPQAFGDFSALAMVGQPSMAGLFSVDVTFSGVGIPGAQPFFIDQYGVSGAFQSVIASGLTTPFPGSTVPDPPSILLCCVGLLAVGVRVSARYTGYLN